MAKSPSREPMQIDLLSDEPAPAPAPAAKAPKAAAPAPTAAQASYDESKIKTLSSLEHIRLRSGMYIGRLGDGSNPNDGIYILVKEVIDNAIDEFIMGHGSKVEITSAGARIKVRDYGRGIPLGKVVDCVSIINTGAKYNTEVFQFSVGLNGVGTKAVNALSTFFEVVSFREGQYSRAIFKRGVLVSKDQGPQADLIAAAAKAGKADSGAADGAFRGKIPDGTVVIFEPDAEIFKEFTFNREFLEERLRNYAYLNQGLTLYLDGQEFASKRGLLDLLDNEVGEEALYESGYYKAKQVEFAFTHTANYGESYFSFVNGQHTSDGGTHLSAFKEGFFKGVNEFYKKDYASQDVREGFAAALAVKLENPIFESQTKNKLGNTEIRGWIVNETRAAVVDFLHKNAPCARRLQEKITQNESLRKELAVVKNKAREAAKKIALKIPNLKDCKSHLGDTPKGQKETDQIEQSTIFITEGQSASGSMVSSRDVYTQAIFSLRGKCQNMHGRKRTEIYQNEELYNMMMALGIENDLEGLRYNRIVLATDADNDGFHIRNLLLTFFLSYFEELVVRGHIFILETPLFRVRNKQSTVYCYSERERDSAVTQLKTGVEVTRFKGLGEINPKEFGQFIGPDIRLVPVDLKTIKEVAPTLEFYMGKNTPQRRDFIMANLV